MFCLALSSQMGHDADSYLFEQAGTTVKVMLPLGQFYIMIIKTNSKNRSDDYNLVFH